jgi:putative oxidoreductase
MGIPLPSVAAPSVALLELFGGLALVAGLFTRAAAVGLALVMLGAMLFVHLPAGFFAPNGIEFVLTLFGAAAALALAGPGGWSVDAVRARRKSA